MAKGFEASMKELEEIVTKLESGDVGLEESLKLFEKGIQLSKSCQKILSDAEKKVSVLISQDGEEPKTKNFLEESNNDL